MSTFYRQEFPHPGILRKPSHCLQLIMPYKNIRFFVIEGPSTQKQEKKFFSSLLKMGTNLLIHGCKGPYDSCPIGDRMNIHDMKISKGCVPPKEVLRCLADTLRRLAKERKGGIVAIEGYLNATFLLGFCLLALGMDVSDVAGYLRRTGGSCSTHQIIYLGKTPLDIDQRETLAVPEIRVPKLDEGQGSQI